MEVTATAKFVPLSPRKARLIMQGIAGMGVDQALVMLRFTPRPGARIVTKVLESAVANAENNFDLGRDSLHVARAYAGDARTLKRFKPRARGRVGQIRRRTSHITVIVSDNGG
jgi:large subunit ribosomal protein L22